MDKLTRDVRYGGAERRGQGLRQTLTSFGYAIAISELAPTTFIITLLALPPIHLLLNSKVLTLPQLF